MKSLQPPSWFYLPNHDPLPWSESGEIFGAPFDLSYSITTGYLNQLIRAHTGLLHIHFQPTWDELVAFSGTVSAELLGQSRDWPPRFNGALLDALLPEAEGMFAELGETRLEVRIAPTMTPLMWMAPDLSVHEMTAVGFPLVYGMSDLRIRFVEPEVVDKDTGAVIAPETLWLELSASFVEEGFSIRNDRYSTSPLLEVSYGHDIWNFGIRRNNFDSCRVFSHEQLSPPSAPCERNLEAAIGQLLLPVLRPILLAMVAEIPAPKTFDAEGHSAVLLSAEPVRQVQINQHITFFWDIPDNVH